MKPHNYEYNLTPEQWANLTDNMSLIASIGEKEGKLKEALADYTKTYRQILEYLLTTNHTEEETP